MSDPTLLTPAEMDSLLAPKKTKLSTMFEETPGTLSMRRVLAFICVLFGLAAGIVAICLGQIIGLYVLIGCFGMALLLLLCTTIQDLVSIGAAIKELK